MIVVVVDNSNIFIGARETVCSAHAQEQIKPKHVKLRLQELLNVAEHNRRVTRGFTAGSSPPTSEQVWEVYRSVKFTFSKLKNIRIRHTYRLASLTAYQIPT